MAALWLAHSDVVGGGQAVTPKAIKETAGRLLPVRVRASVAEAITRDLRELFRVGRMSLAVGASVLAACVMAAQYAEVVVGSAPLGRIVQESLVIMGWVANWRPLEIFLYDWWPIRADARLYRRLSEMPVKLVQGRPATNGGTRPN